MTKTKMYRYLGRNGIITSVVHLDGINYIPMLKITAGEGMILTDGQVLRKQVTIEEEDLALWREIVDQNG